jgi:SAM-dependent methyltransferase
VDASKTPERAVVGDRYVLATGDAGARRLELLHEVYGPGTERLCLAQGLSEGWRVADIGCGTGQVSCWLGERVGPAGHVAAVDVSADQLAIGQQRAAAGGLGNVSFVEGSAYELPLEPGAFDLVFCRLLLCHLQRPVDALAQMARLLRPGGVLVAQDVIMTSVFTEPDSAAYRRFVEAVVQLGESRGVDHRRGRYLHRLLREVGLVDVDVSLDQPSYVRGERKRLWEYSWLEAGPALVADGILGEDELGQLAADLAVIGTDDSTLVAHACVAGARGTALGL